MLLQNHSDRLWWLVKLGSHQYGYGKIVIQIFITNVLRLFLDLSFAVEIHVKSGFDLYASFRSTLFDSP